MSTTSKEDVLEPHARHIGSATLFINADASWSIGPKSTQLVKISYDSIKSIDDDTFSYSAIAAESNGKGGYRLFVRSNTDKNFIVEVSIGADGKADPASVTALSQAQLFAAEESLKLDLNDNGGFGADSVLLEGGAVNLYVDGLGAYQLGLSANQVVTLRLDDHPLTDELLPAGWEIVEALANGSGYKVYAQDHGGGIYAANFLANGAYTNGEMLSDAQLTALEESGGLDIDGDSDLPMSAGWTSALTDPALKALIEGALAPAARAQSASNVHPLSDPAGGVITHAELAKMMSDIVQSHRAAGNTPINAAEISTLQALAARGKAAFTGASPQAGEYLAYVFSKMVEGSDANRFYTAGAAQRSELGSLAAGTSIDNFEKLVAKWLLGGDMPNPATGGDTATGKAQAVTATYAKSTGALFVDGVALADVAQGTAGDCYLIAVYAGLAGTKADAIQNMIVENTAIDGTRTWGVRFFDVNGKPHWVTVNDMLPVSPTDNTKLAYAGSASKALNGEIWVPLVEKAYAQANSLGILPRAESNGQNSYVAVEGGGGDPLAQVLGGGKVTQYSLSNDPAKVGVAQITGNAFVTSNTVNSTDAAAVTGLETTLKGVINSGKVIWIGVTTSVKDSFGNQLLVGSHAHYAIDADPADPNNNTVLVYNPWGLQALPSPAGPAPGEYVSPAPYTLPQLMGIAGLDFAILGG